MSGPSVVSLVSYEGRIGVYQAKFGPVWKFRLVVGTSKGVRPDCGNNSAVVTTEGFLGIEPICVFDVFGECEIGTCVSGNSFQCGLGVWGPSGWLGPWWK